MTNHAGPDDWRCCEPALHHKLLSRRNSYISLYSLLPFAILLIVQHELAVMKVVFFALLLLLAGYIDANTKEIPDELCALIFLISLISPEPAQSLIGMLLVSVPLWIFGTVIPGSVGGGDVKLIAACGAVLGPAGIVSGTMLSLTAYLIFLLTCSLLHREREKTYAMAPWFGTGCFLAYLLETKG